MKKWMLLWLLAMPLAAQQTSVTATVQDSTGQAWSNGNYSISFAPTPGLPGPFYQGGAVFVPQVFTGTMNGSGVLSLSLPDTSTITPAGTKWAFTLCSNTSGSCTTIKTPVTGSSEDFSSLFSSTVVPPTLFSTPLPRAYSSAEVTLPPPNQGGLFYQVLNNELFFWNGTAWVPLQTTDGTVTSVGLALPSIFSVSGSPVTTSGTLTGTLNNENANTVFAGPSSGSPATPAFRALTAADLGFLSLFYQTVASNGTAEPQRTTLNFSPSFSLSDASPNTNVALANVGTAGTTINPSSITTNAFGQITSATSGGAITPRTCNANGCYSIAGDGTITESWTATMIANNAASDSVTVTWPFPCPTQLESIPSVITNGLIDPGHDDSVAISASWTSLSNTGGTAIASAVIVGGGGGKVFVQNVPIGGIFQCF